jgi:outer membrane protein
MKKIITVLVYSKLLAIALLLVACGNNPENKGADVQAPESTGSEQVVETKIAEIAFVRIDSVAQNYDFYVDLRREFEKKAKKMDAEFQSKANALQNDYKAFQEKYEKMLLTNSQVEEQSQRLEQRRRDLQEVELPKIQRVLAEEEAVLNRQVMDAIQTYVDKYNAEKKYALILNAAIVVTGSRSMDITSEILTGLNQEYIAKREKENKGN